MAIIEFSTVYIKSSAAVGCRHEGEGNLRDYYDKIFSDEYLGQKSFEMAESELQKSALTFALKKCDSKSTSLDGVFAGDLLNQCVASAFGAGSFNLPFFGIYGACSTMILSMGIGSSFIENKSMKNVAAVSSSHFCSSERQFRFPLEYGCQRTPTAQWTATAAGAVILTDRKTDIKINRFFPGKVIDYGITDANNMGAAMAPAAADTILRFFENTGNSADDYDRIFTGDLGYFGSELLIKLLENDGISLLDKHRDCGKLIYDRKRQDMHGGGSGCGCVASVLSGYIMNKLNSGEWKKVLVIGTGALLSATSAGQGLSIPSVAHLIEIENNILI